jgi:hypothetical protein
MGVQQTFGGVARVLAPIWAGFAWDRLGHAVPFWTGALMVLGSLGLAVGIGRAAEAPSAEAPVSAG